MDCTSESEAWKTYTTFDDFLDNLFGGFNTYKCNLPCKVISYTIDIDYRHNNSIVTRYENQTDDGFQLHFYYKTLKVEEKTETLVYDVGNFLTAAGGNLGLFLGFSCLSVLFTLIEIAENAFLKHF